MKVVGRFGVLAALAFAGVVVALHWIRPDISFVENYVSEYAIGPWGAAFSASSFVHGIGNLAVATGIWKVMHRSPIGQLGAALFGISALGVLVASVFSTDPKAAEATLSGEIHQFAAFSSFAVEAVALLLLAVAFWRLEEWRSFASLTVMLMALGSVSLVALSLFRATGMSPGIAERIALAAFVSWEMVVALRLARYRSHPSPAHLTQVGGP